MLRFAIALRVLLLACLLVTLCTLPSIAQTLRVTSPNGAEELIPGSTHTISWTGTTTGDSVRLEYSTNSGGSWNRIAKIVGGSSYQWTVPATLSRRCLMRAVQIRSAKGMFKDTARFITANILSVAFNKDGTRLALGGRFGNVFLHDGMTGVPIDTLQRGAQDIYWLDFSPDGKYLAAYERGIGLHVWDLATREKLRQFPAGEDTPQAIIGFSADSRYLMSTKGSTVRLYDMNNGDMRILVPDSVLPSWYAMVTPDRRHVVQAKETKVYLWDMTTGALIHSLNVGHKIRALAVSPDNAILVTAPYEDSIKIWDLATGNALRTVRGFPGPVTNLSFSSDGSRILADVPIKTAHLIDVATGDEVFKFETKVAGVVDAAMSPDMTRVMLGDGVGWNKLVHLLPTDASDAEWAIGSSKGLTAKLVDMRSSPVGSPKDSTVAPFVTNQASSPITMTSLTVTDGDVADFAIIESPAPATLVPGGTSDVFFRFTPTRAGLRQAKIRIATPADTSFVDIIGNGIDTTAAVTGLMPDAGINRVSLRAVPNPAWSGVGFLVDVGRPGHAKLTVVDALGREVLAVHDGLLEAGHHMLNADVSSVPNGIYLYRLTTENGATSGTLAVQR